MPLSPQETRLVLMQLSDSALPTGAFSQSMGLETYIAQERVATVEEFSSWLKVFIQQQLTFLDAVAVRLAMRVDACDELAELAELVAAATLCEEMRRGGRAMGVRLLELAANIMDSIVDSDVLSSYLDEVQRGAHVHPAVVWGAVCALLNVNEDDAVAQHLYAVVLAITQNAVRGIPLGQDAGQKAIARARPWVLAAVDTSASLGCDDLGVITPGLEIAQMRHSTLRARMFMS